LEAYFIENRDISNTTELLQVAEESDIAKATFEEVRTANEEKFTKQVFDEYNEAIANGISGVPAVVIDNRFLISGAVEVEQYQKALEHYREIRKKENNN
jgi:predicted DsbA family dithiol-disulfide isomerase